MKHEKEKKVSVRDEFAEKFISILESEKPLEWTQGWTTTGIAKPYNGSSGRTYNGINRLILMLEALKNDWDDNRFYTFEQVTKLDGCKIKVGSKATRVEYWMAYDTKEKQSLRLHEYSKLLDEDSTRHPEEFSFFAKSAYVFNANQIEGLEPLQKQKRFEVEHNQLAEEVIKTLSENMGVHITYGGDSAFYNIKTDSIHLPDKEKFREISELYGTTLHEFSHATGAESRLDRKLQGFATNSESYAIEELRAEIASTFLTAEIGIEMPQAVVENHMAYVQSWLSQIKENHSILFLAIRDAEKISDYIMEKGRVELLREKLDVINKMPKSLENIDYEVWQLKDIPENEMLHFTPYEYASKFRLMESRYEKVYETTATKEEDSLDKIYHKLNIEKPEGYRGHSLSISDVVVLNIEGVRKAWYCDDIGFKEIPEFCVTKTKSLDRDRMLLVS